MLWFARNRPLMKYQDNKGLKLTVDSRIAILQIDVLAMVKGIGYLLLVGH